MRIWYLSAWIVSAIMFAVSVIPEDREAWRLVLWGTLVLSNQLAYYHEAKDD